MDECELVIFVSTIACAISKNCCDDDLSVLASVFNQLGDTISTILARREVNNKSADDTNLSGKSDQDSNAASGNTPSDIYDNNNKDNYNSNNADKCDTSE